MKQQRNVKEEFLKGLLDQGIKMCLIILNINGYLSISTDQADDLILRQNGR